MLIYSKIAIFAAISGPYSIHYLLQVWMLIYPNIAIFAAQSAHALKACVLLVHTADRDILSLKGGAFKGERFYLRDLLLLLML